MTGLAASQYGVLNTRANLIQGCAYGVDGTTPVDFNVGRGISGIAGVEPQGVFRNSFF